MMLSSCSSSRAAASTAVVAGRRKISEQMKKTENWSGTKSRVVACSLQNNAFGEERHHGVNGVQDRRATMMNARKEIFSSIVAKAGSSANAEAEFYAAQDARHKAFIVANELKKKKKVPKIVKRTVSALVLGVLAAFFLGFGGWFWVALIGLCAYASGTEYFELMSKVNEELPHPPPRWAPRASPPWTSSTSSPPRRRLFFSFSRVRPSRRAARHPSRRASSPRLPAAPPAPPRASPAAPPCPGACRCA